MKILNNQTVGQPLILECSITAVRGITSRVDVVWSSDGLEIRRIEGVNFSSVINNSELVYFTDFYNIPQLSTSEEDKSYHCKVVIGSNFQAEVTESISLNVTG